MTEHLPECAVAVALPGTFTSCICDALRACEQRVAEETETAMMESFYWKPSPPHDQHYFADNICAYCVGHREMLQKCITAVAAMPLIDRRWDRSHWINRAALLAVLHSLKEKP